jgi:AAA+ superfamily predicted ATPase
LAEAIAEALALPLFVVRYELMIGSYLGETATRLKRMIDYARTQPCVLFFDDLDAIGKERGDKHETGEIKRVVSSLLMQVDDLPTYTVVIAATNHAELLDKAAWRRFQLRLELPQPTTSDLCRFIDRFFRGFTESPGLSPAATAKKLGLASFAEAEQFCLDVQRRHVLALNETSLKEILAEQLRIWASRVGPKPYSKKDISSAGAPPSQTT